MELRHLRYFLAVAEEKHFGRAADRVGIVQPALSIQIKALEEELGESLFHRTSRTVGLTEAGELFVEEARLTLEHAERAKLVVQRVRSGQAGKVRIGFAGNAFFTGILSTDLKEFRRLHPMVEIEVHEMGAHEQAEAIALQELDVGYAPKFRERPDFDINTTVIGSWPWVVAMSQDHALAHVKSVSVQALRRETFVLYSDPRNDSGHLSAVGKALGFEPNAVIRMRNTLSVLALAAAGLGVSLVPGSLGELPFKDIVYRPLSGVRTRSEVVFLARATDVSAAVKAYADMAVARFNGHAADPGK